MHEDVLRSIGHHKEGLPTPPVFNNRNILFKDLFEVIHRDTGQGAFLDFPDFIQSARTEKLALQEGVQLLSRRRTNDLGDRNIQTISDAEQYIRTALIGSYERNGYGLYKMVLKEDQEPIGLCGLVNRPSLELPDLGFAVLPEYTRQGYTFEAAVGALAHAQSLGLTKVLAITAKDNQASQQLLLKLNFEFVGKKAMKAEELLLYQFYWNQ